MANNDEISDITTTEPETDATKHSIRLKMWEYLEKNNLVNFPRPVFGRIPNFKGAEKASFTLSQLPIFKNALNVTVNPDKPQEMARFAVLEQNKTLFVPVPNLKSGLLKRINLPENANKTDIRKSVSRRGIETIGSDVTLADDVKIDLVILGSVAVSKQGYRIGKGKGYADLEFAILSQLKAVNPLTVVATTVHDCQLFDTLSSELFAPHDVPVDVIITPTQVIDVQRPLEKPGGVFWNILSQRRLDLMPILKILKEQDELLGKDTTLKETDSDVESHAPFRRRPRKYHAPRWAESESRTRQGEVFDETNDENPRTDNKNRRSRNRDRGVVPEGEEARQGPRGGRHHRRKNTEDNNEATPPRRHKPRPPIDFSLVIRNLDRRMRIRDLKAALAAKGVKPNIITWRGFKGYCCLHFSKNNANAIQISRENNVDNVLSLLKNLSIEGARKELTVEIMEPISRIETTDVTAV